MAVIKPFIRGNATKGIASLFKPRFKILAYHSINPISRDPFEITLKAFEEQMNFLLEHGYVVISLEDAFYRMKKGMILEKSVVITFDDGFKSLARFAFPLLKEFGFPATVFLPFKYINGIDTFSYEKPRPEMTILDWETIDDSRQNGISYGSHTMSHSNLIILDKKMLYYELQESLHILSERLKLRFFALAYPFGMFDEKVKQAVMEVGYDCALCFGNVLSNTGDTDPFELKREKILASTSLKEFARIVDVRYDWQRKMTKIIRSVWDNTIFAW